MTSARWEKYFYSDWMGDQGLRLCSLAARGLWHEINGLMYCSPVRGYLLCQDSAAMTPHELAKAVSSTPREIIRLLAELSRHQVFSVEPQTGAIYCRRIVRTDKRAEINRANGLQGGNPNLAKSDNRTTNRTTNRHSTQSRLTETTKPRRARDRVPETRSTLESTEQIPEAPEQPAPSVVAPADVDTPTATTWLRDVFVPLYAKHRNGAVYFVQWSKHAPMVARLLKGHSAERLRRLAVVLLRTDDDWITATDRGIEILVSKINWLEDRLREWEAKQASRTA